MAKRIGILTGGGDCPGLNAVIRAVVKHAINTYGWEVVGIEDGFQGLYEQRYQPLPRERVHEILQRGGTILGSSNRAHPFNYPVKMPGGGEELRDVSETILKHLEYLDLTGLVCVGGDGTMSIAQAFYEKGYPVVGVPKTIDNDLEPPPTMTFGFQTCHRRPPPRRWTGCTPPPSPTIGSWCCEVMGRYSRLDRAGTPASPVAPTASCMPELPYDIHRAHGATRSAPAGTRAA